MPTATPTAVTVLGSANVDLVATVGRAPAAGETVTGTGSHVVPGGKGANQAIAAARAGARVRMLGAVGDDAFGGVVRRALVGAGVDVDGLATVAGPTGTAHVVVEEDGENRIVVVAGANATVTRLAPAHRRAIHAADHLLLQLEVPLAVVVAAIAEAHAGDPAGAGSAGGGAGSGRPRVVLTPAPARELPGDLLAGVDLLVPNEGEAAVLTGEGDPESAARVLLDRGVGCVVVTLGARGCVLVDADRVVRVGALRVDAVDTTAAGDTFVGALAVALGEGREVRDALHWATAAAGLSVTVTGASAAMPERAAIDRAATRADDGDPVRAEDGDPVRADDGDPVRADAPGWRPPDERHPPAG